VVAGPVFLVLGVVGVGEHVVGAGLVGGLPGAGGQLGRPPVPPSGRGTGRAWEHGHRGRDQAGPSWPET
jgi:hypothetical protein